MTLWLLNYYIFNYFCFIHIHFFFLYFITNRLKNHLRFVRLGGLPGMVAEIFDKEIRMSTQVIVASFIETLKFIIYCFWF